MATFIDISELLEFKNSYKIPYASSSIENKQLFITLNGEYEVCHYGKVIYVSNVVKDAVNYYNGII